jgi:hypothetical protein
MAKRPDRESAPIMFRVERGRLAPSSQFDAEALDALPRGVDLEVTIKHRRSLPQLRAYWKGMGNLIKATECHPTPEKAHEALKFDLGYHVPMKRLDGSIVYVVDSAALSAMTPEEFTGFFNRAKRHVIETFGFDPWNFSDNATQARAA